MVGGHDIQRCFSDSYCMYIYIYIWPTCGFGLISRYDYRLQNLVDILSFCWLSILCAAVLDVLFCTVQSEARALTYSRE